MSRPIVLGAFLLLLGACATPPVTLPGAAAPAAVPSAAIPPLQLRAWEEVAGWNDDDLAPAWQAFRQSCAALRAQPSWQAACDAADALRQPENAALSAFFREQFTPYQATHPDGNAEGLITGYYEPLLSGSRTPSARYRYPLYAAPEDILVVDLAGVYPELKNLRLRGRLQGNRVVPYFSRAEIENGAAPLQGRELFWVDNPVELFFLQIQGSGRIRLESGETVRIGYAEQNGHPYKSIGRLLVERGELPLEKASMQGIKLWATQNPGKVAELLNSNPSYVFFRELPDGLGGPLGALGVPLSAGRSIAVDPRVIPLGAPVFLSTTWPNSSRPLNRLMLAQDTGGAIRGAVRADFFWGFGDEAGKLAGGMKQSGRMWVLLPKGYLTARAGSAP